jgi:hypothetical protein
METFAAIDFRKRLPMTSPKSLLSGDSQTPIIFYPRGGTCSQPM